jgi:restriction system protein
MSRGRRSRRRRSGGTLETGLGLAALGIFMLMLPVFMDSPLQQSALEPLQPLGWFLLLAGAAVCAWCFRPDANRDAPSESLAWLSRSTSRRTASRVTPDRKASGERLSSRRSRKADIKATQEENERRAALKAAIKANIQRMTSPNSSPPDASAIDSESSPESEFADTVMATSWPPSAFVPPASKSPPAPSIIVEPLRAVPPTSWNPRVFQLIEWRRFEAVIEALFAQAGFKTRSAKHPDAPGADGGIDIWLYSRHARQAVSIVQCKHWQGRPVSATELKRFYNVMVSHEVSRGTYATTSTFTEEAKTFAAAHGIHAMDGAALLELIGQRTPAQQEALLKVAFEGEYWRPTCSSCGVKLVQRGSAENGSLFWGCTNFPGCRMRMPIAA